MQNRVLILMSTYNAEKYLVEQIKSLREQRNVCVSILCRDDGSTDNTIHILKSLGIDYYTGGNLGPARSFMDLVEKCSETYEYYAFCAPTNIVPSAPLYLCTHQLLQIVFLSNFSCVITARG